MISIKSIEKRKKIDEYLIIEWNWSFPLIKNYHSHQDPLIMHSFWVQEDSLASSPNILDFSTIFIKMNFHCFAKIYQGYFCFDRFVVFFQKRTNFLYLNSWVICFPSKQISWVFFVKIGKFKLKYILHKHLPFANKWCPCKWGMLQQIRLLILVKFLTDWNRSQDKIRPGIWIWNHLT